MTAKDQHQPASSRATATFAIHSTVMELRSAGYQRQALQTSYLAEGGTYAALAYIDVMGPQAAFVQYSRTQVASSVAVAPGSASLGRTTNVLRVEMDDFVGSAGVSAPPLERDIARQPSLGPHGAAVPTFTVDGTDLYRSYRQVAGRDGTGRNPMTYVRLNLTSRGRMAPPGDYVASGDPRSWHESSANARAYTEMGPFAGGM